MPSQLRELSPTGFRTAACLALAIYAAPLTAGATTTTVLQLDLNSITVQAFDAAGRRGWGGTSHTGTLVLGADADALLSDIIIDDESQTFAGRLTGLSGEIRLSGGAVTGGSLTVTAVGADAVPSTYMLNVAPTLGPDVLPDAPFVVFEATAGGRFSAATFAGADVKSFFASAPLDGAFLLSEFAPDALGYTGAANLELFATASPVPEPAGALWAGLAAAAVAVRRRRRR